MQDEQKMRNFFASGVSGLPKVPGGPPEKPVRIRNRGVGACHRRPTTPLCRRQGAKMLYGKGKTTPKYC